MWTKFANLAPPIAAKLTYRNIHLFNKDRINSRGPLVVLAENSDIALISGQVGRDLKNTLAIHTRSVADNIEVYGKLGSWQTELSDDDIGNELANRLELGEAILVHCSDLQSISSLLGKLLALEIGHQGRLGINVVIAAQTKSQPVVLRSDLWVHLSSPSDWQRWLAQYPENPNEVALAAAHKVRDIMLTRPADETLLSDQLVVERLRNLYTLDLDRPTNQESPTAASTVDGKLKSVAALAYLEPAAWSSIKNKTRRIFHFFKSVGVTERNLTATIGADKIYKRVTKELAVNALLLPVALWGVVNHYLIFKAPQWFTFWTGIQLEKPQVLRAILLPFFYFIQVRLMGTAFSWSFAFMYLITLPICGFVAIAAVENRSLIWDNISLIYMLKQPGELRTKLLNLRWEILEALSNISESDEPKEYAENLQHQNLS